MIRDSIERNHVSGNVVIHVGRTTPVHVAAFRDWTDGGPRIHHVGICGQAASLAVVRCPRLAWRLAWRIARTLASYERRQSARVNEHGPAEPGAVRWRLTPAARAVPVLAMAGGAP